MVLILVLMEDGLRVDNLVKPDEVYLPDVLILVLMEDGLREMRQKLILIYIMVLILVLMEDGLRVEKRVFTVEVKKSGLNPCFNGRWSAR